jgi:diguanylate cyclase (GGDEF)-like protein/PAS domain S-box-containing protein
MAILSSAEGEASTPSVAASLDTVAVEAVADRSAQSGAMAQLMIDSIRDYAVFMIDTDGRVLSWNTGARRIMGYTAHEVMGRHVSEFYPEDLRETEPQHALEAATRDGHYRSEGWQVKKDGSRFWASMVIETVCRENGDIIGFAEVTRDTTERRCAEEALRAAKQDLERRVEERTEELKALNIELERQADTDCLTGIWNRRGFLRLAAHEIQRSARYRKPFAILFIDLDDFKTINDAYGHAAGDRALQLVVAQMGRQLRAGDVMARIGGDEFVLLLLETTVNGAVRVAKRLCRALAAATTEAEGASFTTMVSVGVAQWRTGETIDLLLARADAALYSAKEKAEKGCVIAAGPGSGPK